MRPAIFGNIIIAITLPTTGQFTFWMRLANVIDVKKSKCVPITGKNTKGLSSTNKSRGKPSAAPPKPIPERTKPVQIKIKTTATSCPVENRLKKSIFDVFSVFLLCHRPSFSMICVLYQSFYSYKSSKKGGGGY